MREELKAVIKYLKEYDGPEMNIMEVCGSHTAAIAKNGIPTILPDRIRLISGPGCPVCVTPSSYIDRLIQLSMKEHTCVVTFGDLMRVPGSETSLSAAKGEGARVAMVYSPMDILDMAAREKETTFIFAAVGFETTMPVYALLVDTIVRENIPNIKLLTALKTMPPVIDYLCRGGAAIDGFLAPGHVAVVTGSDAFEPLAEKYSIPFGVSGFSGPELLIAIAGILKARGEGRVMNFYPSVVTREGNERAEAVIDRYFDVCDASWRGMGAVTGSGRILKKEYDWIDAGSRGLDEDRQKNRACRCGEVLMGKIMPTECPLHGKVCTPLNPQGACMVSTEGSCYSWYIHHRTK